MWDRFKYIPWLIILSLSYQKRLGKLSYRQLASHWKMEAFYSIWRKYEGAFDSIYKFCLYHNKASLSEDWGGLLGYCPAEADLQVLMLDVTFPCSNRSPPSPDLCSTTYFTKMVTSLPSLDWKTEFSFPICPYQPVDRNSPFDLIVVF